MAKADLHCHSMHSRHPSEWFLQRIGTAESYTKPDDIYKNMISRGMNFFALTDHNTMEGSLYLKERYPEKVITGVETTTYFPEDRCKIHLLVYGINPAQFERIQSIRNNIYTLRDYVVKESIPHSLAHATFSINNKLTPEYLEKLILLFNVFEGYNGARSMHNNVELVKLLTSLTPEDIENLYKRHRISPHGEQPWIKGFTGGSDDHAGLYHGRTYTVADNASTPDEFLQRLINRETKAAGGGCNFQSLTFHFYKIAVDFSTNKSKTLSKQFIPSISRYLISGDRLGFKEKLKFNRIKHSKIKQHLQDLIQETKGHKLPEERFKSIYTTLSKISDEFLSELFSSIIKKCTTGDIFGLMKNISSVLPTFFLSAPFFSSMRILHKDNEILPCVSERLGKNTGKKEKRILWFSDTIFELNGPSATLRRIAEVSKREGISITLAVTAAEGDNTSKLPEGTMVLPAMHSENLPYYKDIRIRIPSVLQSLEKIDEFNADEIIISTPGPLGILALVTSIISNIPVKTVFHTDFMTQIQEITNDENLANLAEGYIKWFYNTSSEIMVPSKEYIKILNQRMYDIGKCRIFPRGIDTSLFRYIQGAENKIKNSYKLPYEFTLLYAGRISEDKNIQFLANMKKELDNRNLFCNLLVIGEGPYLSVLKSGLAQGNGVVYTGRMNREMLPLHYSGADLFLLPSRTDTFGMAVLEAAACGLPSIVSDIGGPQELARESGFGRVLEYNNITEWISGIKGYIDLKRTKPDIYNEKRIMTQRETHRGRNWEDIIRGFVSYKQSINNTNHGISEHVTSAHSKTSGSLA